MQRPFCYRPGIGRTSWAHCKTGAAFFKVAVHPWASAFTHRSGESGDIYVTSGHIFSLCSWMSASGSVFCSSVYISVIWRACESTGAQPDCLSVHNWADCTRKLSYQGNWVESHTFLRIVLAFEYVFLTRNGLVSEPHSLQSLPFLLLFSHVPS